MASVRLFLREYDKQGQNETITERNVEIPAVPLNGQSILVTVNGRLRSFLVTGTYIPCRRDSDDCRLRLRDGDVGALSRRPSGSGSRETI